MSSFNDHETARSIAMEEHQRKLDRAEQSSTQIYASISKHAAEAFARGDFASGEILLIMLNQLMSEARSRLGSTPSEADIDTIYMDMQGS